MAKTKSLSVHRNTIENRRKRERATAVSKQAGTLLRDVDVRAYAIVAIDAQGSPYALWDTGGTMPMIAFPSMVATILTANIGSTDVQDDWRPTLTPAHKEGRDG